MGDLNAIAVPLAPERLGRVDYAPTWAAMRRITLERGPDTPDRLWLCEHPPVYTQGLAGKSVHILNPGKPKANRFVLGASGHIAGVINPASKKKRSYWTGDAKGKAKGVAPATAWMESATEHVGSWWPEWAKFLVDHGGKEIKAPAKLGNAKFKPIEAAPGRYVKVRAD